MSEIVIQPTTNHLYRMMSYLNIYSFSIPSFDMELPECIAVEPFKSERIFRIMKSDMQQGVPVMYFEGVEYGARGFRKEVYKNNIHMNQRWIDRAFLYLVEDVKNRIKMRALGCGIKNVEQLALKFNKLEFISL